MQIHSVIKLNTPEESVWIIQMAAALYSQATHTHTKQFKALVTKVWCLFKATPFTITIRQGIGTRFESNRKRRQQMLPHLILAINFQFLRDVRAHFG